jgi:carbon-monoxide dehydrogenase large subunit
VSIETVRADEPTPNEMVGSAVQRREDPHLLTGESEYADDIQDRDLRYLALARSQYGHATVQAVDTSAVEAMDGVVAVYTAADVAAELDALVSDLYDLADDEVEMVENDKRPVL